MFLEDGRFFDNGDDELVREMIIKADRNVKKSIEKVASYWDIYQNGEPPVELGKYIARVWKERTFGRTCQP